MPVPRGQVDPARTFGSAASARAFTLVELMAALLIVALLAGAVSVSLKGVVARMRLENAVDQIESFDRLTREQSRRTGRPLQLRLRPRANQIVRVDVATGERVGTALTLPPEVVVGDVSTGGRATGGDGRGDVSIPCSTRGLTPSYALRVGVAGGGERWLVVAGLTGETTLLNHESDARNILALLGTPATTARLGDDAD